ncbi:NAD(P)/FAD-dependent oxidoreductase [Neolewinella lacunae]|uniref:NAD(P)/FAD-dependent oxidoreductase n=1 Tax=Neolewinella lacunae TaxID=1517758 RepID=A0A923PJB7_9BACT|nr:NAD(P)/FAD-dependent oxidoreductase [Neolewinella lacunae]MBC6995132.1 NAD(P)/FAD-dependent oxidoreductase [Neolewinella lacunae]MDN3634082.1 NAD(P)/FAD-dependent oxidoreductase [Neolewinella lacunae]
MKGDHDFEVIIIGGSYSGLSAAMALGRSLRKVLIIDSGKPCNRQTPHAHNFLTHDGKAPGEIASLARQQVEQYPTILFHEGLAVNGVPKDGGFAITTDAGEEFRGKKLLFASGVKDLMPDLPGFAACWGISVIHCPYCHGYEVRQEKTGILANGHEAYHYGQLLRNWTQELTIFTNGVSTLTEEQHAALAMHDIPVVETEIAELLHRQVALHDLLFVDGTTFPLRALYSKPAYVQHCPIPEQLGLELTEQGLLQVDAFQDTTLANVLACGDCASPFRALSYAIATGTIAGAMLNHGLVLEAFDGGGKG